MVDDKPAQLRWFAVWLWGVQVAIGLFILTFAYTVPGVIAALQSGNLSSIGNATATLMAYAFLAASVLGLVTLVLGLAINAIASRRDKPPLGVKWGRVLRPVVLMLALFVAVTALTSVALQPVLKDIFKNIVSGLSVCSYPFRLVAFDDQNANGIRDLNEPGVANVQMTGYYPAPRNAVVPGDASSTGMSSSAVTDSSGLATVSMTYTYCPSSATEDGSVTLTVQVPPGYKPTTETTFGTFSIKFQERGKVRTVYAGFTKGS